jgi:hypothetical protein
MWRRAIGTPMLCAARRCSLLSMGLTVTSAVRKRASGQCAAAKRC